MELLKSMQTHNSDVNMSNVELVSIERVNNPTFDEADPQKRRTIVLLGVTTYNNIPRHELVVGTNKNDDVIRDLEQQLLSLRRSQENELKTQRERLRVEYDTEINGLRSRLDYMTSKEQTFYEDRDRYAMEMVDRCMITKNQELEKLQKYVKTIEEMNEMLRKETEKRTYSNNTEKGKDGENMIESYIIDNVPTASIVNTANVPNCTDFRCAFGNYDILIESKHVANVKRSEVEKFARDVRTNAQSVQGAIFVSITDGVRIPCKRSFDYEMIDGVPCIYISGFASNKHMLIAALQWLELYNRNVKGNVLSSQVFDLLYKTIDEWQKHFGMLTKHKRSVRALMDDVITMENNISTTIANTKAQIEAIMYHRKHDMEMCEEHSVPHTMNV